MKEGERLGPYEIVAPLGAGGMGEVYRARDERLGRDVAIKVLPTDVAADPDRLARFEREAQALAALSHPNILGIFDFGRQGDVTYAVTELLEGETLRERLRRERLPWRKAVEIAAAIADGLAAAHGKGIIHRDLKPDNVFVTSHGRVKILDFGLARLQAGALQNLDTLTSPPPATLAGAVLGTVGYMAPEQVRGEPADARSDIFALGCVLYEMLTLQSAFARDTAAEAMAAILREPAPEVSVSGIAATPELNRIVAHCLEKQPAERFQSVSDVAFALRSLATDTTVTPLAATAASARQRRVVGPALAVVAVLVAAGIIVLRLKPTRPSAAPAGVPKIVVLPFENLGSPDDAYFAAGMTEEITSRLANVQGLGVISRTSAVQYDRKGKTIKQIGSDLGVDYVLEGSVRWDRGAGRDSRVRITPQLIRVADDTHVWADRYERVIADVFAMQSEVAENAVKAMGVTLLPREQTKLEAVSTNDLEAYDLYLRGQELARGGEDRRDFESSLRMYQAAVDRDPRFAQALAGLAIEHLAMYFYYFDRSQERVVKAKEAAERAVELRPDLAETHIALGYYFYWGLFDYPRALGEFDAALKIQPNNSAALASVSYVVRRQGHWADSAKPLSKALELDPRNPLLVLNFAQTCVLARRYADADRSYGLAIALNPQSGDTYEEKAGLQIAWHGDLQKAQAVLDEANQVAALRGDRSLAGSEMGLAVLRRDYKTALRQLEAETRQAFANQFTYRPIPLVRGLWQMLAGQHDLAGRSFEAALVDLEQKLAQNPDDPRFHSSLGIAYAGLGRREDAVREARLGCDLMPPSKDAWNALYRLKDLAFVYTMVGQPAKAIAALDDLLARSGLWTPHRIRLEPWWDPLRLDPRFQALLTKYEVKE